MAAIGQARTIEGLKPLFDPKRVDSTLLVDGANVLVGAQGVSSAFARECILRNALREPRGAQAFRLREDETSLLCTQDSILRYDDENRQLIPLLAFPPLTDFYPWSSCTVGGNRYFARRGVGLIEFNVITNTWSAVVGPEIPVDIVACCEKGGRLVVVAPGVLAWSAIDDARDMTPSTQTGAGAQSLSLIGATEPQDPLMVLPYNNGVLTYTLQGIMKSELVISVNPFRHRPMGDTHIPVNGYCAIRMGQNDHVILTRQGFFTSNGEDWQPWQPEMGEYFHTTLLPSYDLADPAVVRLTYDRDRQWFFVSLAEAVNRAVYNRAYMLHLPVPQWGLLNRVHTALVDFRTKIESDIGNELSYVDNGGTIWRFTSDSADLACDFENPWVYDYRGNVEWPGRQGEHTGMGSAARMPTCIYMRTLSEGQFLYGPEVYDRRFPFETAYSPPLQESAPATSSADMETLPQALVPGTTWDGGATQWDNGDTIWDPEPELTRFATIIEVGTSLRRTAIVFAPKVRHALESYADIGVFRAADEFAIDVLSQLVDVQISSSGPGGDADVFLDFVRDFAGADVVEDWGEVTKPTRDYGFERDDVSDYTVTTKGTIDGVDIYEREERPADLVMQEGRTKVFSADTTGMYHIIRVVASEPDESYQIQTVEIRAINVGRLT